MKLVCAGDCGVDRYVDLRCDRPGGIALNVAAVAKGRFPPGTEVVLLGALGTDPESAVVLEAIRRLGLGARLERRPGATSVQYIDREPSGEKVFVLYEQGVLEHVRLDEAGRRLVAEADVLVTTVYRQILGFFESVLAAPCWGLRAVDFGDLRDFDRDPAFVAGYADRLDVAFFGLDAADAALVDALEAVARAKESLFVVTLGARGSLALAGGERWRTPARPVPRVVDTTGAGDAFAAGFLAEYVVSRDVAASLEAGAAAGADAVARLGAFEAPCRPWTPASR